MIPQNAIREWVKFAPWADLAHVEQDLVITRALIQIYNDPHLSKEFAFRGGTAMQKLFLDKPARYSEDIDLVQLRGGPIGPALDAIRKQLDPWLGTPRRSRKQERFTLTYHYQSETPPTQPMRLKVEINNGENFTVFDLQKKLLAANGHWFSGKAELLTYEPEELLGTKLRALYQRKKGRDLFDMAIALKHFPKLNDAKIIECFQRYLAHQKTSVSRAQFEKNLSEKMQDQTFLDDIAPLVRVDATTFNWGAAEKAVHARLIERLPGEPWKGIAGAHKATRGR